MDRLLCVFAVKDFYRKGRKVYRKGRKEDSILTARRLGPVFYNARAYEIKEEGKAAPHAGGRTGLSTVLRRAHVHAAALHSASGGSRPGVDWHSVRRRNNLPSWCALRPAQHSSAIGHDSAVESGDEGQSVRKMARRRFRRSLDQPVVD